VKRPLQLVAVKVLDKSQLFLSTKAGKAFKLRYPGIGQLRVVVVCQFQAVSHTDGLHADYEAVRHLSSQEIM